MFHGARFSIKPRHMTSSPKDIWVVFNVWWLVSLDIKRSSLPKTTCKHGFASPTGVWETCSIASLLMRNQKTHGDIERWTCKSFYLLFRAWMWAWAHTCATAASWNQGQLFRISCFFPCGFLDLNSSRQVLAASTSVGPLGHLNAGHFKFFLPYRKILFKKLSYFSLSSLQIIVCF